MQKISPCLWFDNQAEEAAQFYTSIFNNSKIVQRSALIVVFELEGRSFMALNGGPVFQFTPAISLMVNCATQEEVDRIWEKLSADKAAEQCGWLKDKYGVSWQIVPEGLGKMMQDKDPKKVERMTKALLQMKKLDLNALKRAFEGEA